jgi:hypothetical protein
MLARSPSTVSGVGLGERSGVKLTRTGSTLGDDSVRDLRRTTSIRELRQFFMQTIPDKLQLFRKNNLSTSVLLESATTPVGGDQVKTVEDKGLTASDVEMKSPVSAVITDPIEPIGVDTRGNTLPSQDQLPEQKSAMSRLDWTPELSPVSFKPTLSVEISPLSPPVSPSPPPSRSRNFQEIKRKLSFRSNPSDSESRRPTSAKKYVASSVRSQNGHERRRSKYLNDPSVLSLLDRKFEEALELGFTSPPATPRSPSPPHEKARSPITPSVDGTTLVEVIEEEEEEEDIFTRPTPNLTLPTLRELDDGEWTGGAGEVMTLRLTLTPATCLTEVDEALPMEVTGGGLSRRMSGLGRILSRTRSKRGKI